MGLLMSLPLAGGLTSIATSCFAGLAFFCTSKAGIALAILLVLYGIDAPQLRCSSSLVIVTLRLLLVLGLL